MQSFIARKTRSHITQMNGSHHTQSSVPHLEDRVFITTIVFTDSGYLDLFPAAGEIKERARLCQLLDFDTYSGNWPRILNCYASCSELFFRIVTRSFLPRSVDVRNKQGHIWGVLSWICLSEAEYPSLSGVVAVNTKTWNMKRRHAVLPPPHNQFYSWFWYAFSLFLMKFHSVKPFNGNFCELGRAWFAEKKMEFPSQVVSKTYSILFSAKFGPFSKPFGGCASAVHDERAEWTCSRNVLFSKMWNPPRIEVETLW